MFLEAAQIRAARALLDWTVEDLAKATGLNKDSIKNAERGHTQPRATTSKNLREAFERAGVIFTEDSGVKRRSDMITILEGENATQRLLDDIYLTMLGSGGEIYIAGLDEKKFIESVSEEYLRMHIDRIVRSNISEKLLIEEGDTNFVANWAAYRWMPKNYFSSTPFYVYANHLALIEWGPPTKIVILDNAAFAKVCRGMFEFIWNNAQIPPRAD